MKQVNKTAKKKERTIMCNISLHEVLHYIDHHMGAIIFGLIVFAALTSPIMAHIERKIKKGRQIMFWVIPISGDIGSIIGIAGFITFLVTLTFPSVREMWWGLLFAERNIEDIIEESAYMKDYQAGYNDGLNQVNRLKSFFSYDGDSDAYNDGLIDGRKDRLILEKEGNVHEL